MKTSESIVNIAAALVAAQSAMGNATKDSSNPFFKSKYADLNSVREACLPLLNKNGISALQPIVFIDGKNFVETILLHSSGEYISSLTEIVYSKQNDAQAQGSGITYARRYGLQSLVNIGGEDDDGNSASKKPDAPQPIPQQQAKPAITPKAFDQLIARINGTEAKDGMPPIPPEKEAYEKAIKTFTFTKDQRDDLETCYQNKFPK